MKYVFYLTCFLFLGFQPASVYAQKTYIVNNAASSVADFHTFQAAIDSAPAGSILLLQPSAVAYENVTIRKKLAIYGNGFFLGQNAAPATQANSIPTKVQYINFAKGSDGAAVYGLQFTQNSVGSHTHFDSTSNINIARCYFESQPGVGQGSVPQQFSFNISSGITIQGCYIATVDCHLTYGLDNSSGVLFQNNIINGGDFGNSFVGGTPGAVTMDHNTIVVTGSNFYIIGWILTNNIFIKQSQTTGDTTVTFTAYNVPYQGPGSSSKNNVANYSIFSSSSNKILPRTTTTDSLFITSSNSQNIGSTDGYFILKPNTPAAGYAIDRTDCGAFGGTNPYVLSGIPAIPNIYFLQIAPNATQSGGVKLTIKAKANN